MKHLLNPTELLAAPAPVTRARARTVRLMELDQEEPTMPKGVYDRKSRAGGAAGQVAAPAVVEPAALAASVQKKRRKRRAKSGTAVVVHRKAVAPSPRFDVSLDLRKGAVTINAASGSLTLAPDELQALFAFLGKR